MSSLVAARSMLEALVGMMRAIDAARNQISSSSSTPSAIDELVVFFIHCRGEIENAAVFFEAAVEAASAGRDATASRRLGVRIRCLKLMAKSWRGRQEQQQWRRCMRRCYHRSTERRVLSLKRLAAVACREAEKRVAGLLEPQVSAAEAVPAETVAEPVVVDDAEGTALADFRAMAAALLTIGREEDATEESEEYRGLLRGMERLFSSA